MPAMTPIKEIWVVDCLIYALDYADHLNPIGNATSATDAVTMAAALGKFHKRKVFTLNVDHRMMVLYQMEERG